MCLADEESNRALGKGLKSTKICKAASNHGGSGERRGDGKSRGSSTPKQRRKTEPTQEMREGKRAGAGGEHDLSDAEARHGRPAK